MYVLVGNQLNVLNLLEHLINLPKIIIMHFVNAVAKPSLQLGLATVFSKPVSALIDKFGNSRLEEPFHAQNGTVC